MANVKKMDVPDIGGLLGQIAEKRHDLPKTPIQSVNPVGEKPVERKTVEPAKRQNKKAEASTDDRTRGVGGRPSTKKDDVEYVKLSPRVPKLSLIHISSTPPAFASSSTAAVIGQRLGSEA